MPYCGGSWMGEHVEWISFIVEILSNETNFAQNGVRKCFGVPNLNPQ